MRELQEQVRAFMQAGDQHVGRFPGDDGAGTTKLGLALIDEEHEELKEAIESEDLGKTADAICDLLYVTTWLGVAMGLPLPELMAEVQRANMAKFGPGSWKDGSGKVRKPPGWRPPDIEGVLLRFMREHMSELP